MTLSEAIRQRTLRLTRLEWNEYAHIELAPDGYGYGTWVTLRDVWSEHRSKEQQVLTAKIEPDGWEAWKPPSDVERFLASWPTYG